MNENPAPGNQNYSVHAEMQAEKKKISFKYFFIYLIVGLFITAGILYFVNGPKEVSTAPSTKMTALVVMASAINDDFAYSAQPNNEYTEESTIYIYVEAKGVQQDKDGSVDVSEDVEIKDESGNVIFSKNSFASDSGTYDFERTSMRFNNAIPSTGWSKGKHYAKIVIHDNKSGKSLTKSIAFTINEGSSEEINALADLSTIISNTATARLVREQIVWDPSGKIIDELSFSQPIATDLSTLDLKRIMVDFKMPERFPSGTYAVEIKYTNLDNGQSKSIKQNVVVSKGFEISEFVFASSIDDNYDYVVQPNNQYAQGQMIYIYSEVVDFEQPEIGGQFSAKLVQDVYILDANENIVASQPRYLVVDELNGVKQDYYRTKTIFKADLEPGNYILKTVFKDGNSGKEAIREESFIIG